MTRLTKLVFSNEYKEFEIQIRFCGWMEFHLNKKIVTSSRDG